MSKRPRNNNHDEEKPLKKKVKIEIPPPFSSNDFLRNYVIKGDKSTSIVGYVDDVELIRKIRYNDKELDLFKFLINNNEGTKVHCFGWENEAHSFSKLVHRNQIVLLEMLTVREPSNFNRGNVNYELQLKKSSSIKPFGFVNTKISMDEMPLTDFKDIHKARGTIKIEGYVRNDFVKLKNNEPELFSVITNLTHKIDMTVFHCSDDVDILKGQKVCVVGDILEQDNNVLCLHVRNPHNIKVVDTAITPLHKLLEGYKCIVKTEQQ